MIFESKMLSMGPEYGLLGVLGGFYGPLKVPTGYIVVISGSQGI